MRAALLACAVACACGAPRSSGPSKAEAAVAKFCEEQELALRRTMTALHEQGSYVGPAGDVRDATFALQQSRSFQLCLSTRDPLPEVHRRLKEDLAADVAFLLDRGTHRAPDEYIRPVSSLVAMYAEINRMRID